MKKVVALFLLLLSFSAFAQDEPRQPYAPDRRAGEGEGPFERMIIRGVTVIDGSGAPPIGPLPVPSASGTPSSAVSSSGVLCAMSQTPCIETSELR